MLSQQRYAEASLAFAASPRWRGHRRSGPAPTTGKRGLTSCGALGPGGPAVPPGLAGRAAGAGLGRAGAALGALRLEWRNGAEAPALSLFDQLAARPEVAERDGPRGPLPGRLGHRPRPARPRPALAGAGLPRRPRRPAGGRLLVRPAGGAGAERPGAVARYLEVLRADRTIRSPARAEAGRLAGEALARTAAAEGRRLAPPAAWTTPTAPGCSWAPAIPDGPDGAAATPMQRLLADRRAAPYLRLAEVPVRRWPLWDGRSPGRRRCSSPWASGTRGRRRCATTSRSPIVEPRLHRRPAAGPRAASGPIHRRWPRPCAAAAPAGSPWRSSPPEFRRLLYPFPYRRPSGPGRDPQSGSRPLAALIREESRFDISRPLPHREPRPHPARLATARRLAAELKLDRLDPERPLPARASRSPSAPPAWAPCEGLPGRPAAAVAAYGAGETQAMVWRTGASPRSPRSSSPRSASGDPGLRGAAGDGGLYWADRRGRQAVLSPSGDPLSTTGGSGLPAGEGR